MKERYLNEWTELYWSIKGTSAVKASWSWVDYNNASITNYITEQEKQQLVIIMNGNDYSF